MKTAMAFYLRYLLIAGAIAGACYSAILAYASYLFHQDRADSVLAAVRLVPYKSEYVARWATWNKAEDVNSLKKPATLNPSNYAPLLKRAIALNPFDYESMIQLGLYFEINQSDAKMAENYYLQAEAVNHMYEPKWTLTNFYFRQQNTSDFFRWANETLEITPYDGGPVFTQMWLMSQDAQRLSAVIPNRPRSLIQYTWFLSNSRQFTAIPPIIQRLVRVVGNDDPRSWGRDDLIAASLDHVLASGDWHTGLQIWSTLRDNRWIAQNVPDANHPLTNGDFRQAFYKHGFDWAPKEIEGIHIDQFKDEPSIDIGFSGDEAEHCEIMRQYVAIEPGFPYHMQWKAEAQNMLPGSGVAWHLRAANGDGAIHILSADILVSPQEWDFVAPPSTSGFVLTLEYNRAFGHVRPAGHLTLRNVTMERQQ